MIQGIPDGWDQERVGQIHFGEYWVNNHGDPQRWENDYPSTSKNYVIIRKIEKPKKYRPFQNPTEAESLLGEVLRFKADHESKALFVGNMPRGVQVGLSLLTLKQAFETLERLDGTPFGIEVTE